MNFFRLCLSSAALALISAHPLGAQSASPNLVHSNPKQGLIGLDVVVTDQRGNPVAGIDADKFTLLDGGQPVKILTFHAQTGTSSVLDEPVSIILLVDTLDLPESLASQERREVERFLRQNGGRLAQPVSLIELSNMGILTVGQPTVDGNTLAADFTKNKEVNWIRRVPGGLRGESLDTLLSEPPGLSALKALGDIATRERQLPGRKLLIWVGPGWGVGSGSYMDSTGSRQNTFDCIEWFSTLMREARTSIYSLSVGETNADGRAREYLSFLSGVTVPEQARFMHLNRKVLAVQTGGRVLEPKADLVLEINGCVREASTFYTLSFDPSLAGHPDDYHSLKVQVNTPGLTARTTTGYYDQPYYSDQGLTAGRAVSVAQLEQLVSALHDKSDSEQALQLSELTLTERLSDLRSQRLIGDLRGGKARQALLTLADSSAFLDLPGDEIPTDPPPEHANQQRLSSMALQYLNKTVPNLPNFYATRTTEHFQENPSFDKGDLKIPHQPLHLAGTEKDTVSYRSGYEVSESTGGRSKRRKSDEPYLVTYGSFAPILRGALDSIVSHTSLTWSRWEKIAGRSVAIFRYAIPEGQSSYDTGGCCLPDGDGTGAFRSRVGYHGEIAVDPDTGAVLRLELVFDLNSTTPLIVSEILVEYGPVDIGGKTYICPVKSVSISRGRSVVVFSETLNARPRNQWRESFRTYGPYATMMNDVTFESFHLFHADSRMLTGP